MHSNSSFIMQELIWKTMTMHLYDAAGKFVSDGGKSAELEVWKKSFLGRERERSNASTSASHCGGKLRHTDLRR